MNFTARVGPRQRAAHPAPSMYKAIKDAELEGDGLPNHDVPQVALDSSLTLRVTSHISMKSTRGFPVAGAYCA